MTERAYCGTCQHFDEWGEGRGACRRNPPMAIDRRTEDSHPSEAWPTVLSTDWCGDWRAQSAKDGGSAA